VPSEKADLIIHPMRLRILQLLADGDLTTQQIVEQLGDIPPLRYTDTFVASSMGAS